VIEALDAIWQEAIAHGVRPGGPPPRLFEEPAQTKYEEVRNRSLTTWQELKIKAQEEDQRGTGEYPETERLLDELNRSVQAYFDISLPRLRELLT